MTWLHLAVVYVVEHLTAILIFVLAFLFFARVLRDQDKASTSFAWIVSIVLVPFLAIPAYLVFGGRKVAALVRDKRPLSLKDVATHVEPGLNAMFGVAAQEQEQKEADDALVRAFNKRVTELDEELRQNKKVIMVMGGIIIALLVGYVAVL